MAVKSIGIRYCGLVYYFGASNALPVGINIYVLIILFLERCNDNLEVYRPFGFHLVTWYVGSVRSNSFRGVFAVVRTERLIMKHVGASNRFSR